MQISRRDLYNRVWSTPMSKLARELLQITNLDTLWAIYDSREEALEAVGA